jgi:hypothetical protein
MQCVGGDYGVLGLRQINTCREVPLLVNFFLKMTFCFIFFIGTGKLISQLFNTKQINIKKEKKWKK